MRKLKFEVTPSYLLTAYYALFHSHINYGIVLWGHAPGCARVLTIQKAAVRIITSSDRIAHCKPLFDRLGILTIYSQFVLSSLVYARSNLESCTTRGELHSYNVRTRNDIHIPRYRLSKTKESNPVLAYQFFNRLPREVRELSPGPFKRRIMAWLKERCYYSLGEFIEDDMADM